MLDYRDIHGPVPKNVYLETPSVFNEKHFAFSRLRLKYFEGALGDGFSNAHNFIAYVPSGKLREHSEPNYFHYTSVDNFRNIIKSGSFWASQLGGMNDPKEVEYAKEKLLRQISLVFESRGLATTLCQAITKNVKLFFEEHVCKETFCVSLSKRGNLSSQWSKYSCERGVSFSLNTQLISFLPEFYPGVELVEVVYDTDRQLPILKSLAEELFEFQSELINTDSAKYCLSTRFKRKFEFITIALKHSFYSEEEEFRIIIPSENNEEIIKTKPSGVGRYADLDFMKVYNAKGVIDIPLEYVFTAPTKDEVNALKLVEEIIDERKVKFGLLIGSGASFIWPNNK